jgi:hypothetical protein
MEIKQYLNIIKQGEIKVTFGGSEQPDTYLVSTADAVLTPTLQIANPAENINTWPAQYLVISHGAFVDGLQPLVEARQA